jgi:hypothetical protein
VFFPRGGSGRPRKTDYTVNSASCAPARDRPRSIPWTSSAPRLYGDRDPVAPPVPLVDRTTELEPDKRIVGIKNVTLNERTSLHKSGELPVLPPSVLTEAVAQSARF